MARLRQTKSAVAAKQLEQEKTVNYEGATAYSLKPQDRLISQVLGAFWNEDTFYTKKGVITAQILKDIQEVAKTDPKFVLQLAAFARNEIYLRTTPQVLLVEAANIEACKPFVREYTPKIVKRADELAEVVAYQTAKAGGTHKGFPNSLKKGLADAFKNFDEYQLNKYDSSKSEVSLGDVTKLVHPEFKGDEEYRKALYAFLTKDEVSPVLPKLWALKQLLAKDAIDEEAENLIRESSVTWETLISKFGSTKENWTRVFPNMGYMALLRNLRNFEEKGVDLAPILKRIVDEKEIARSKQLPFRFYSAYKNTSGQKTLRAIAQAFEKSITNVTLTGKSAILVDLSGSMFGATISEKSSVYYAEISSVLGAIATKKSEDSIVIGFGTTAAEVRLNPDDTMMSNIEKILALNSTGNLGHGTNAWTAFDLLGNRDVDRVFLFSDMQCYDTTGYGYSVSGKWKDYQAKHKNAYLYSFNLAAYGTSQTSSKAHNVVLLNGWSDKILDYAQLVERRNVMVENIKKY